MARVARRLGISCRLRYAPDLCVGDSRASPPAWQRMHAFARRAFGMGTRRKLSRTVHGESSARGFDVRSPRLRLLHAMGLPVHPFQGGGEYLLALQGVLSWPRKACASLRPFSAPRTAISASQGALLIAHLAQTLARRLEVIKRGFIDFGMVTAQDDLMLVIAENAALEFTRYGHGGPLVSCAAANEDWYYDVSPYQYGGERVLVAGCAMAVNKEPVWRSTPMSGTANADSTTDGITWHAIAVDDVVKRLATDIGKGLEPTEAAKRLQKYGPNRLPEGKKRGPFMRFLSQFNNILVYVLLGAGIATLMLTLRVHAAITCSR